MGTLHFSLDSLRPRIWHEAASSQLSSHLLDIIVKHFQKLHFHGTRDLLFASPKDFREDNLHAWIYRRQNGAVHA